MTGKAKSSKPQAHQDRYNHLFLHFRDAVILHDPQGRIVDPNPRACEYFGYTRQELKSLNIADLHPASEINATRLNFKKLQSAGLHNFEIKFCRKNGQEFTAEVSASAFEASGEKLVQCIVRDITDRRQVEQALQIEQAYVNQLFESTPEAIVLLSNDNRITRINKEFRRLFGYRQEEIQGTGIDELIAPGDLHQEALSLTQRVASGEDIQVETVRRRKDGSLVDVSIMAASIVIDGRQTAVYGIYRDISRRKRKDRMLETLNRAALAMQKALTHREIFKAISKELRTLDFGCLVFTVNKAKDELCLDYLNFESAQIKSVEKLLGFKSRRFSVPFRAARLYKEVIEERKTVVVEDYEELARNLLPQTAERLVPQLIKLLRLSRSVAAPMLDEEEVTGVFSVQSNDLTEEDIPRDHRLCQSTVRILAQGATDTAVGGEPGGAEAYPEPAVSGAKNGSDWPSGRWHRPRFQQPADRNCRIRQYGA